MRYIVPALLVGLAAIGCSSGSDSGVTPVNDPPTISFTFAKLAVAKSTIADLTVAVTDPDGDPLTVTWTITRGTLTQQNAARTIMRWTVPATVGADTVQIRVTDGAHTRTIREPIWVGTATAGATALVFYKKVESPYIVSLSAVTPVLSVLEGGNSDVEPGTMLLLDTPATVIDVTGTFTTRGTSDEPVIMRSNARGLNCGDDRGWWDGLKAGAAGGSNGHIELNHTELWHAEYGIRLRDGSSAEVEDSKLTCSGANGILFEGNGKLEVTDSEVSNGRGDGIAISALASIPDSVVIRRCALSVNDGSGLRVNLNDQTQQAVILVEFNRFEFNSLRAITLANASFPEVHFNLFTGNGIESGVSNVFLESGYPAGAGVDILNMECNYWGPGANQTSIDGTIRDFLDTGAVGTRIDTDPWLTANPITVPPTCTP